jgi:hypothetical protein
MRIEIHVGNKINSSLSENFLFSWGLWVPIHSYVLGEGQSVYYQMNNTCLNSSLLKDGFFKYPSLIRSVLLVLYLIHGGKPLRISLIYLMLVTWHSLLTYV